MTTTSTSSLVEQVLSGENPELQAMAASGLLPLPPNELIPIQVTLARSENADLSARATEALRQLAPRVVADFLSREASPAVMTFFALEVSHPTILQAILQRRDVDRSLLVAVAPSLDEELQEILLLRQDAIIDEPRILESLERNPHLTNFSRRRIQEYRTHLLPREEKQTGPIREASDEEVQVAIEQVKKEHPVEGELDDQTGLSASQIRLLTPPVRMRLTRGASRALRAILVQDVSPTIALACLEHNNFSDPEIEGICNSRRIHEEVLLAVTRNRTWMSRYTIIASMVKNPKAPLSATIKLVPRLSVRDLRDLRRNRNVPDPVRKTADRMYRIKLK